MGIVAADWYDAEPDETQRYQGDLLSPFVLPLPPADDAHRFVLRQVERDREAFVLREVAGLGDAYRDDVELTLGRASLTTVLVVTQTCDIDQRMFVQVAPVRPAAEIKDTQLGNLRKNRIGYLFYLPEASRQSFKESYADLSRLVSVPASVVRSASLAARLTPTATVALQSQLARMHGRLFAFSERDEVPQTAKYLCFTCFASDERVSCRNFEAGSRFESCGQCGQPTWIKRVTGL